MILILGGVFLLKLNIYSNNKDSSNPKDFVVKAFHVDLRAEVMTLPALKDLAKQLAAIDVNTIVMEWEATYPYEKHATLSNKYSYSRDDIKSFINYCSSLEIDVIPLQNCFGHVEYILRHDRYSNLREDRKEVSQVCPMKEVEAKAIFTEIFTEMAALHPSKYFHIGGDETYLLGSCPLCSAKAEAEGKSKLFVDYVKVMCEIVTSLGKTPVLWADILLKYPESADQLPKEAIFIDWNYGWKKDKFGDTKNLIDLGIPMWGAPSIRSGPDNLYITQWKKHFDNISSFIPDCRNAGYKGIVMTSWSTSGQYGFSYEPGWEVISMYPIRYVYPLSGFNILIAAYGEALKNEKPLDSHNFIVNYGQSQFGFSEAESEVIYEAMFTPQNVIRYGKDTESKSILSLKHETTELQEKLRAIHPKTNKKEFEHLLLMFDLRHQYVTFKDIENRYQSKNFERSKANQLMKELEDLRTTAIVNDRRFIDLNKNYLHDDELLEINRVRNEKFYNLYNTIKNITNKK